MKRAISVALSLIMVISICSSMPLSLNASATVTTRNNAEQCGTTVPVDIEKEVLDSGKCGEKLTWTLYSDGLLHITGTGRAYDYCKGVLIGKTRKEIESNVKSGGIPEYYAFQKGKTYDDEHGQYVSPWYKYRDEVSFTEDGGVYCSKQGYDKENPNGWKYNRIQIDPGITYIGDWMFYRVSGPEALVIPEGVTRIGRWGIRYSPTLKSVELPDSLTEIEYRGVSRNEVVEKITFGSQLTTIGDYAFSSNKLVEEIIFPETVTSIGINQFEGNDYITTARLGHVTSIPSRTFVSATKLKDIIIPEEVTSIGEYAFYNCVSLKSIKIPSKVTSIDKFAFYKCENLRDVFIDSQTIADLITDKSSCGYLTFNAHRVYLKEGITSSFFETGWKYIETIDGYKRYDSYAHIESDNIIKSGYVGPSVFYIIEKTKIDNEYKLTIDGSGDFSCYGFTNLPWYEYKNNIVSVCIDGNVTDITGNCFNGYSELRTATVSCENIVLNMFYNCSSLETVVLTGARNITDGAFFLCDDLNTITIPDSVVSIGEKAFYGCENLEYVFCEGTKKDWENINISQNNECLKTAKIHYSTTDHTESVWITHVPPTCKSEGEKHTECTQCGLWLDTGVVSRIEHHVSSEWITDTEATVHEVGSKHKECTVCGLETETAVIPQLKCATPKLTKATNTANGVKVTWDAVEGVDSYRVYRRAGGVLTWSYIGTTTTNTFTDAKATNNKYWIYTVIAVNEAGYSGFDKVGKTIKCVTAPKVTGVSNAANGLYVKWNAVPGAKEYRVYRKGLNYNSWLYLGTTKNTWFIDSPIKNSNGYYYKYTVIAVNDYCSGFYEDCAFTKRLSNPVLKSAVSSKTGITVKWNSVYGSTGYYVYRKTANSGWTLVGSTKGANNATYIDKTAKKGVTYTYTVRAYHGKTFSSYNSGISCKDKY